MDFLQHLDFTTRINTIFISGRCSDENVLQVFKVHILGFSFYFTSVLQVLNLLIFIHSFNYFSHQSYQLFSPSYLKLTLDIEGIILLCLVNFLVW